MSLKRRSDTWRAPSSVARTCLKLSQPQPVLIYRPRKGPGCKQQLAYGSYATACGQQDSNPRGRWSRTLTTMLSRHPQVNFALIISKLHQKMSNVTGVVPGQVKVAREPVSVNASTTARETMIVDYECTTKLLSA